MVGDLRMWLYRATPGNPRHCAGADHSPTTSGRRAHHGLRLHPVDDPDVGGFRHSDTVVVTEAGYDLLTEYPSDLESLTLPA
jgi:hypothetical protein